MSDLTRYTVWDQDDCVKDPHGDWVYADEAEARIKELEAQLEKADELADAVREADAPYGHFERVVLAYYQARREGQDGE